MNELAGWEIALLTGQPTPGRPTRAEQAERWPALHDTPDGGTIDLAPLWNRLSRTRDAGSLSLIHTLADEGGGAAIRLKRGIMSLLNRRDMNTNVHTDVHTDGPGVPARLVTVTAWSWRGAFRRRAWWLQASWEPVTDQDGMISLVPEGDATFAVRGHEGGVTVFRDDEHGELGHAIARWYREWHGRRSLRDLSGAEQPDTPDEPITLADFLNGQPWQHLPPF